MVNVKDENNMEIFEINIINNGKIEKNKLFLSEIEDEINLKIEIERTIYFSKSDNIFDSVVELRKKLELKNIYLLCNVMFIRLECKKNLEGQRRINYKWENKLLYLM